MANLNGRARQHPVDQPQQAGGAGAGHAAGAQAVGGVVGAVVARPGHRLVEMDLEGEEANLVVVVLAYSCAVFTLSDVVRGCR